MRSAAVTVLAVIVLSIFAVPSEATGVVRSESPSLGSAQAAPGWAARHCEGHFGRIIEVNGEIEYNAYTQCTEPHDLWLKVNLQRRNKNTGGWRDVWRATGYRVGYILNVWRSRPCTGNVEHRYRMKAFPKVDGVAFPEWGTTSDVVTITCYLKFLANDRPTH